MTSDESRLEILRKVEDGTLSIEEGSDLIRILDEAREVSLEAEVSPAVGEPKDPQAPPETLRTPGCWKAAWSMVLLTGTLLATFSVYWVYQGYQKAGLSWGFWLSWIPFIIGTVVMIIGGVLLTSPWLHLRLATSSDGKNLKLNLFIPIPLNLVSWGLRTFRHFLPAQVKDKNIEDLLDDVDRSLQRGEPFLVDVDENEDGEQVFVSISR